MRLRPFTHLLLATSLAALAIGCGGDDEPAERAGTSTGESAQGTDSRTSETTTAKRPKERRKLDRRAPRTRRRQSTPEERRAAPSGHVPQRLVGTYSTTLGRQGGSPAGTWVLRLGPRDRATLRAPAAERADPAGPVVLSHDQIVFPIDPECPERGGRRGEGRYNYVLEGRTLTFLEIRESCPSRSRILVAKPWKKR